LRSVSAVATLPRGVCEHGSECDYRNRGRMEPRIKGIVPPPLEMPQHLRERGDYAERRLPPMIVVFVVICFWRAFFFMVFASILGIAPNSKAAHLVNTYFDPHLPYITAEFIFFAGAILYAVVGWCWLRRDWLIRWVTMFLAGATAARTLVLFFAAQASGVHSTRTDSQHAALVVSTAINLFICAYLAFYPGINQVFKETTWD
jgi:hypothetical protein